MNNTSTKNSNKQEDQLTLQNSHRTTKRRRPALLAAGVPWGDLDGGASGATLCRFVEAADLMERPDKRPRAHPGRSPAALRDSPGSDDEAHPSNYETHADHARIDECLCRRRSFKINPQMLRSTYVYVELGVCVHRRSCTQAHGHACTYI